MYNKYKPRTVPYLSCFLTTKLCKAGMFFCIMLAAPLYLTILGLITRHKDIKVAHKALSIFPIN